MLELAKLEDLEQSRNIMTSNHHPPTSADVARLAGVSRTTVSYVLNETPNLSIKPETRERVLAAARELNYQLQPAARTLRKGQSDDIYFVADRPLTLFIRDLIRAYRRRARELGYNFVVCFGEDLSAEATRDFLLRLFSTRPAGIIASSEMITPDYIELARSKGAGPLVSMVAGLDNATPAVSMQIDDAAKLVTEHLLERGHRQIGLIAPQARHLISYVKSRLETMKSVLETEGACNVRVFPMASASLAEARRVVQELRDDPARPTALYGFNDEYCFPLLRALHEQGLRVPKDLALAGTDNLAFGEMTTPSLTTVGFDLNALGARVIDLIHILLRSEGDNAQVEPVPPPTLIHREST
jgi:DNA-binding LacI/PurR family transcriptional regulator